MYMKNNTLQFQGQNFVQLLPSFVSLVISMLIHIMNEAFLWESIASKIFFVHVSLGMSLCYMY